MDSNDEKTNGWIIALVIMVFTILMFIAAQEGKKNDGGGRWDDDVDDVNQWDLTR